MAIGSRLRGILDELIATGYPDEVAERIVSGDLPMDTASRMQRAEAMGFDPTDVQYHGTEADITQFRPSAKGKMGPGVYTTPSPSKASVFAGYPSPYAEGGNVMPLLLRGDYIKRADAFDLRPEISGREGQRILNETLEGMGYAGSKAGERGSLAPEVVTFDPRNVRSLFAAFDPEYTGSNILGDRAIPVAGAGLLAAAAMAPEEAEAGVIKTFGREFDPRFDPRAKEQERLRDAVFSIEERGTQDMPRLALSSLEGRPFVTTQSDRTQAGGLLTAINDVDLNVPVDLRGGQGFMFENPAAWASGGNVITSLMKARDEFPGENPLLLPYRMTPTGGDFATMTGETMISYASANMTNKTKKQLDKQIKELIPEWKGVDDPESIKQFQNAKTNVRKYIQQQVMDVNFRNEGGLSIGEARLAVTDPKQAQAGDLQIQNIGEIFAGARTPSDHPAYPFNLPGQGLGYTDQEVNIFELMPEARVGADQRFVADPQRPTRSDARALEMKPYTGRITEDILRGLEARGVNINANPIVTAAAVAAGQEAEGLLAQLPEKDTDEFNYGDILPIKRAKDPEEREGLLGGYSPAYTGIVEDMVEGLLKFSTQAKRGLYNPTAATEFLL